MGLSEDRGAAGPRRLAALAVSTTLLAGLYGSLALARTTEVGRIREIGAFWFLRRLGAFTRSDFSQAFPSFVHHPYDLVDVGALGRFFLVSSCVNALLALALTAVAVAVFKMLSKTTATAAPLARCALPAAVLVGCATPEAVRAFHYSFGVIHDGRLSLARTAVFAVVACVALAFAIRRAPKAFDAFSRGLSWAAAIAVGLGLAAAVGGAFETGPGKVVGATGPHPNILLVSIDSLRADHVGAYGYPRPTTPTLDRLAREGVRFETAVAPTSWTLPSHITLLTALDPLSHGVRNVSDRLDRSFTTLPEVLKKVGYATAGFVSGPFLDASHGFLQGFDHYDDYTAVRIHGQASARIVTSPLLLGVLEDWLKGWARRREQPFFVFLHMWDPHYDYLPPEPIRSQFTGDYKGEITGEDVIHSERIHAGMPQADLDQLINLYDGEIRHTDEHVGKALRLLERLGVLDDTIVVVTADHGEEFFEHQDKAHGKTLYDEVLRVPLIFWRPGLIPAGAVASRQARLMDVPRTLLALAGVDQALGLEGEGPLSARMLPEVFGKEGSMRPAVGDLYARDHSIRTEEYKLIVRGSGQTPELFDLRADPREQRNLAEQEAESAASLRGALEQALAQAAGPAGGKGPVRMDAEQRERLRSLGYIE